MSRKFNVELDIASFCWDTYSAVIEAETEEEAEKIAKKRYFSQENIDNILSENFKISIEGLKPLTKKEYTALNNADSLLPDDNWNKGIEVSEVVFEKIEELKEDE